VLVPLLRRPTLFFFQKKMEMLTILFRWRRGFFCSFSFLERRGDADDAAALWR